MNQRGFTLIEVMIVAAVLAILAAIVLPSYTEQVRKGRRADALAAINETAQALERFYTLNNTFEGYELSAAEQRSPRSGDTIHYDISMVSTANTYMLSASPRQEDRCGVLQMDNRGLRFASGDADCVR